MNSGFILVFWCPCQVKKKQIEQQKLTSESQAENETINLNGNGVDMGTEHKQNTQQAANSSPKPPHKSQAVKKTKKTPSKTPSGGPKRRLAANFDLPSDS